MVDDKEIRKINAEYRHRDRVTNVLSFSMQEGEFGAVNPHILGDIVISVETALQDAVMGNLDLMDEIEFLLIHGLLHLMGYNHEDTTPKQAEEMMTREHELFFLLRRYHLE